MCLKMLDSQMDNVNSNSGCLTWFWHFIGPAAGCPYSCVARAPDVFSFAANTGCARAVSQGTGQDYRVQLAVGQCPRNCIHWVTPLQRTVLEDILEQALQGTMFSTEALMLEALVARAKYENGRYQPPKQKRKPKGSNEWVDWF
jgi:ferredoxin